MLAVLLVFAWLIQATVAVAASCMHGAGQPAANAELAGADRHAGHGMSAPGGTAADDSGACCGEAGGSCSLSTCVALAAIPAPVPEHAELSVAAPADDMITTALLASPELPFRPPISH